MNSHNRGLLLDPIDVDKDYQFGGLGSLDGPILQEAGQWHDYLPEPESQLNNGLEPQACVSFGTLSALEILLRRIYTDNPDNFSDRFLAKVSGTTKSGNTPQKVAEALRKQGVPREVAWPIVGKTWEEFYAEIPNDVKILAQEFPAKFDFKHEYVTPSPATLKMALQYGPLGVAVSAWSRNGDGLYTSPFPNNHWCVLIGFQEGKYWEVFDSYAEGGSFVKRLTWDHQISQAKRYQILIKVDTKSASWWDYVVSLIKLAFGVKEIPTVPPAPIPAPKPNLKAEWLQDLCLAIKKHEGWYAGSRSQRNNNPGNCKFSAAGYLPKYGKVGKDAQGFAIFKDYATGYLYLQNLVLEKCRDNPTWNLYKFFDQYAPDSDNNDSDRYAEVVAQAMGVSPKTWTLSNLL